MPATPTIQSVLDRMMEVWVRHDMAGFGALFAEDADFVNIFGDWLKGRTEIADDHARRHEVMFASSRLRIEAPTVRGLRDDVALVHWRWTMEDVRGPGGMTNKTGLILQVMERRNRSWSIVASHNTETRGP